MLKKVLIIGISLCLFISISACSQQGGTSISQEESSNISPGISEALNSSEQSDISAASSSSEHSQPSEDDSYYQGLTQEQWNKLQAQKAEYGDLSEDERLQAQLNGYIDCINFIHLEWEEPIALQFAAYVGHEEFNTWAIKLEEGTGECCNIYDFANDFAISLDELVSLIETNGLTRNYDIEIVKRRYEYFNTLAEDIPILDSSVAKTKTELEPYQLYYDFFSNNFSIIEYRGTHGQWQLWGHSTHGEVRLTKQVYIHQIEGFDYPVLILAEYTLGENGVTLNGPGLLNAYLIKNGELTSDLTREEFDAIFKTTSESEHGWSTRYENEILLSVIANGKRLFLLDFSGDVRTDGSIDIILEWLREN